MNQLNETYWENREIIINLLKEHLLEQFDYMCNVP